MKQRYYKKKIDFDHWKGLINISLKASMSVYSNIVNKIKQTVLDDVFSCRFFSCFSAYISIYFGHILILLHAFVTLISFLQETKFFPCHSDWALGIISAPVRYKEISGPV